MFKNSYVDIRTNLKQLRKVLLELKEHHKQYSNTFLVKQGESLIPIEVKVFAFFNIKANVVMGTGFNKSVFTIDSNMEDLETELNPSLFYRVNRQFIVNRTAIESILYASNGKLIVIVTPKFKEPIVVSKAKSRHFREWMGKY